MAQPTSTTHPIASRATPDAITQNDIAGSPPLESAAVNFLLKFESGHIDDAARAAAERLIRDQLAVQIGCSQLPWSKQVLAYANAASAPGRSSIIGSPLKMSAADAAFVNSTYASGFEYDDTHLGSNSHPGCCVVPASLAIGQELDATLGDILSAMVAGYEVYTRIGILAAPELVKSGYQPHPVLSVFGAAAVAAKLRGFNADMTLHALGNSLSFAAGTLEPTSSGGSIKRAQSGIGARGGMVAADLARAGVTGPRAFLTGHKGFYPTFVKRGPGTSPEAAFSYDAPLQIHNVWLKAYCCCGCIHPYLDAVAPYVHRLDAIQRVVLRAQTSSFLLACSNTNTFNPQNIEDVQFSLPVQVAFALLGLGNGYSTHMDYMAGKLDMEPVRDLMQRITVKKAPELDLEHPGKFVADISIEFKDGSAQRIVVDTPLGTPGNPLSDEQQNEKFLELTRDVLGEKRAAALLQTLQEFDTSLRINDLMEMCATHPPAN